MFFALLVFDFEFVSLKLETFCTYNWKHWLLWMWLHNGFFYVCKKFILFEVVLLEGYDGWIMWVAMCHVIFFLWMLILTFFP
jgi:hypothetical protein